MNINIEVFIILILITIIFYLCYIYYYYYRLVKIKSNYNNKDYYVQDTKYSQEAADLLSKITEKIEIFNEHIKKSYPNDPRTIRILENYRKNSIKEAPNDPNFTSYSVNKGEEIRLCVTNNDRLMDLNTMMFVTLHEMGHLASESIGHTTEFWDNFRWILEESINIGVYIKQDFKNNHVEYCGISITSTPLDNNNINLNKGDDKIIDAFKLKEGFKY